MNVPFSLRCLFALLPASLAYAQTSPVVEVAPLSTSAGVASPTFVTLDETESDFATFRYSTPTTSTGASVNGCTLLFAHASLDPNATDNQRQVLAAMQTLYPFLEVGKSWNGADSQLGNYQVVPPAGSLKSDVEVRIPPYRIARHVQAFLSAATPGQFGPDNMAVTLQTPYAKPWQVTNTGDERFTWSGNWYLATGTSSDRNVDVKGAGGIGQRALTTAAFQYASQSNSDSVGKLSELIQNSYRWLVIVQAVHVNPSTSPAEIRFSQPIVMRRRSLGQMNPFPWWNALGPDRWSPSTILPNQYIHFSGQGELMQIPFDADLAGLSQDDLIAYMPLASGQWASCPRVTMVGSTNVLSVRPDVAVFAVPATAVSGNVYFAHAASPLNLVRPRYKHFLDEFAAPVYVYTPGMQGY